MKLMIIYSAGPGGSIIGKIFLSALCFLVILLAQISEKPLPDEQSQRYKDLEMSDKFYVNILDMDLFPGKNSNKFYYIRYIMHIYYIQGESKLL